MCVPHLLWKQQSSCLQAQKCTAESSLEEGIPHAEPAPNLIHFPLLSAIFQSPDDTTHSFHVNEAEKEHLNEQRMNDLCLHR